MKNIEYEKFDTWVNSFVKVSFEKIERLSLLEETKNFLINYGLPPKDELDMLVNFYIDSETFEKVVYSGEDYIVIGDDYGTKICMSEKSNEIISIDTQGEYPIRYINSSIRAFLIFIKIYKDRKEDLINSTDEEACKIVFDIKEKFKAIDCKALKNTENWWSLILEQTEQGLM